MTDFKKPSTWLIMFGVAVWGLACMRVGQKCFHRVTKQSVATSLSETNWVEQWAVAPDEGALFSVAAFVCVALGASLPFLVIRFRQIARGEYDAPNSIGDFLFEVFYGCFMTVFYTIPLLVLLHVIGLNSFLGVSIE